MSDNKILLSPTEASAYVGLSERQLYLANKRGDLTVIKPSGPKGRRFYRRVDLDAFINGCAVSGGVR